MIDQSVSVRLYLFSSRCYTLLCLLPTSAKLCKNAAPQNHFAEPNRHVLTFLHPIFILQGHVRSISGVGPPIWEQLTHPPHKFLMWGGVVYVVARTFEREKTSMGTRGSRSLEQAKTSMGIRGGSILEFVICHDQNKCGISLHEIASSRAIMWPSIHHSNIHLETHYMTHVDELELSNISPP